MTDFLPLFPLKMVVFPGESLNLHIFEPRYKQLIRECEQNGVTFGIPAFIDKKVMDFGTEIQLEKIVKRHDDGKMDIKTKAIGVFKIKEFFSVAPNKLYAGADIERLTASNRGAREMYERILLSVSELFRILNINKEIPKNPSSFTTFDIAHHVGFSIEQEYQLLCISSERERQNYMLRHLQKLIPVVKDMERLRKKAQMNGHFKNVLPPKF